MDGQQLGPELLEVVAQNERSDQWTEVDNTYITNQRRFSPTESVAEPPTLAWLIGWNCRRKGKRIVRKRFIEELKGDGEEAIDAAVVGFIESRNAVVVESPRDPRKYEQSNAEPVAVC